MQQHLDTGMAKSDVYNAGHHFLRHAPETKLPQDGGQNVTVTHQRPPAQLWSAKRRQHKGCTWKGEYTTGGDMQ